MLGRLPDILGDHQPAKTIPGVAPELDNLDTVKANGESGIRFRDPQVIGAGERGNAYDVSGEGRCETSDWWTCWVGLLVLLAGHESK